MPGDFGYIVASGHFLIREKNNIFTTPKPPTMKPILSALLLFTALGSFAQPNSDSTEANAERVQKFIDSINANIKWEHGAITLPGNHAKLNVPTGFKFLNAAQSQYVLTDLWGNPKDNSVLGMVFPESASVVDDSSWAFVVTFQELGYVKDEDADKIDYDDLLKDLKESDAKDNEERKKLGLETLTLVGWASKPFYDKDKKVLHWAKEFKTSRHINTLNYDIRILGRKGVLSLNAVAGMDQLPQVKANINNALSMAEFTEGNQYKDFDPKVDEVAAWTIGGLVAGKLLAKAGFFALILKFWKLIALGLAAFGGAIWRFITGKKKKQEELAYEAPAPSEQQEPQEPQS